MMSDIVYNMPMGRKFCRTTVNSLNHHSYITLKNDLVKTNFNCKQNCTSTGKGFNINNRLRKGNTHRKSSYNHSMTIPDHHTQASSIAASKHSSIKIGFVLVWGWQTPLHWAWHLDSFTLLFLGAEEILQHASYSWDDLWQRLGRETKVQIIASSP